MISVGECGERVSSWNLLIHASEALNICRRINWGGAQSGAGPKTALSVVNIVEPHSGRLYLRTHYEHKTLALMSGVVRRMALRWLCIRAYLLSEGKYGGDFVQLSWAECDGSSCRGWGNEFRSGYSGSGRGSGVWNNNHGD
ncbi:hypothetical protein Tco_0571303 [Tanacetum coccineum]